MNYSADYLINRRKEKWQEDKNIERDKQFREVVAEELIKNDKLLKEVIYNPEKLIELLFIVVDKNQKTMPFFFNDVQQDFINKINNAKKDYENGKITEISFLILKGRQQGFTTLVTAYQLANILLNKNFQGLTVADESSNTEAIFQNKAKFPYDMLPDIIKPTEKFNNKRQLLFEKLNSSWAVDTATKNMGRSRTINFFHGSECAFWRDGIAVTQAGLGEAFTKNCIKIYETTANGFNEYRDMWKSGQHINCFYEWWKTKEYFTNFESDSVKRDFIYNIEHKKDWIYERLKWLKDCKKLKLEQLYWYYKKYMSYLDKELIKQEYPCSEEEAFVASGACIFDKENIIRRIDELKAPQKVGYFIYDYDGIKIKNIAWKDDENGFIKLYELPKRNYFYVIGGDTSGEGSDNFTGQVLNNITGNQVAVLKHQFDEDIYARQMYCLGIYYNKALIGVETNFSTYPQKELERLRYPNFYIRMKEDTYTNKTEKAFGFNTNRKTRPIIIAELVQVARDMIESINDIETLEEMLTFIRNENGKAEAQLGCHDDLIMALAIAHYIRPQQKYIIKKNEREKYRSFNFSFEKEEEKEFEVGEEEVYI